ncbi:DUF3592 domain-containing protein [Gordonia rhizosphera]|uniref:DUF3592 domain-containing protein n=1 Tax=Gordonia rhizosphera NBRC 16068 TaxID=1108045 RepID=K6W5Y2_9ACTN|nr:DUF3592 domain-containing protein [Gordonia rhizosphera]GAB89111.1 hypothetical protein GORHZ_050_00280 [Gordonia rhizosphera NBRC 16068]
MNPTILRRTQIVLLLVGLTVTTMAVVMVAGCHRNDTQIDAHKATVMADVVSASRLHAAVNFQTPDGQFHSPRLGLLYPTELTQGQRISVEYDATNPDLARPAGRDWTLAIIPALSVAVVGWIVVGAVMLLLAEINRRLPGASRTENDEWGGTDAAATADQTVTTERESPETSNA